MMKILSPVRVVMLSCLQENLMHSAAQSCADADILMLCFNILVILRVVLNFAITRMMRRCILTLGIGMHLRTLFGHRLLCAVRCMIVKLTPYSGGNGWELALEFI
jgi:hypothetical protein